MRPVSKEQWVEATDFFNSLVIVSDCLENNLCLEFAGPIKQVLHLSEDIGIPIATSLIMLVLVNNNLGHCIKDYLKLDNLLVCPKLKLLR